jgi:hypothetical protein
MTIKTFASALIGVLLVSNSFSRHRGEAIAPRLLTNVTEFGCCGLDLELNLLADALRREPEALAHIIGYSAPVDPPGKLLRYLQYIESNLRHTLGNDSQAVSVVNGGLRDAFALELWIVPKGANPPAPSPSITTRMFDYHSGPVLFDESDAIIMDGGDDPPYLAFDLHCGLGDPLWGEFFRILEHDPDIKGHVTIYVGRNGRSKNAKRIKTFLRSYLKEHFSRQAEQITMKYGGTREKDGGTQEWSEIEIWLEPAN